MGIEDETGVVFGIGDQSPFKLSDSISAMISDACTPQIETDITIKTVEDKTVLEIDIPPGNFRPYYLISKGKEKSAFIRINGTSRPADSQKLQELEMEGRGVSYDSLQDVGRKFDQKKALQLCSHMKQAAEDACKTEEEKSMVKDMSIDKLEDLGLLCKVGRKRFPTHAFDLLTDNHNKAAKIQCALFKGNVRDIFIEDNEHRLEEIKSEISKQEKKFKECEARIDTVLDAEKPVKKELEAIQKNTKQLPAILNKEPRVSLPKKDYDHLVKMARSSGTLKKLNETYDRRITKLQEKINTLTDQVNIPTDRILKAEAFMKVKGRLEEFKAFLQPKSIKSLLFAKKRQADEQNKSRGRDRNRTKNGMAI